MKVGIAGVGFMGWIHYLAYRSVEGIELAAVSTRDARKRAGDWTSIKGNFGPRGEQVDLSGISVYENLEDMLADGSLDVIDICLPPAMHADVAVAALQAGKHVFCEKPMALTVAECDRMVAATEAAQRQLLIGQVLPFLPEYQTARQLAADGTYGKALGGTFKRVISDPLWIEGFFDPRQAGGPLVDLHVHDAHFIRLLFGMPESTTSVGRMRGEVVEYCNTVFRFADPNIVVAATSGVINQQGRGFTHGYELHFERATLHFELAVVGENVVAMPLTVFDSDGNAVTPELGDGDMVRAFEAEIAAVVEAIQTGQPSPVLGGDLARDAITLCHQQTESVQSGRPVG